MNTIKRNSLSRLLHNIIKNYFYELWVRLRLGMFKLVIISTTLFYYDQRVCLNISYNFFIRNNLFNNAWFLNYILKELYFHVFVVKNKLHKVIVETYTHNEILQKNSLNYYKIL